MPQHINVAESEIPIPVGEVRRCCECQSTAAFTWPNAPTSHPQPYCEPCLNKAKHRLYVALGLAAAH